MYYLLRLDRVTHVSSIRTGTSRATGRFMGEWDYMNIAVFETRDLRVRIENKVARIDQRKLDGEPWLEIDQSTLPVPEQWFNSPVRSSPLKVALMAFERENPGNMNLRIALKAALA